jgi:hypothetical protein
LRAVQPLKILLVESGDELVPVSREDTTIADTAVAEQVRARRARAGIPDEVRHWESGGWRWTCSIKMIGQWGCAETAGDCGYGDVAAARLYPTEKLVRPAKIRWRIEHDYRELKTGLSTDLFEGRSFAGWYRHVTLAVLAQAFCTLLRLDARANAPA